MKLGFCSAILPETPLDQLADFAAATGYQCIEVMCWPVGKAERRYAGVTHIDVSHFTKKDAQTTNDMMKAKGVSISALGYYPNALSPNTAEATVAVAHIKRVIRAAALLGVNRMNTFIGRDWTKSVDANWPRFVKVWKPIIRYAEAQGVKVGIENCPMLFSADEWPGGKNLAYCPAHWRRMFAEIPSKHFGLNYDPSHLVWQQIDPIAPITEFAQRIFHVHAKDVRIDYERLDDVGILAAPLDYHSPKLPGLGEVDWGSFFSVLSDTGYRGPVCVEVEDRAYEGSVVMRKAALEQSARFLSQFVALK